MSGETKEPRGSDVDRDPQGAAAGLATHVANSLVGDENGTLPPLSSSTSGVPGLDIVEPDLGDHNGDHEELASRETGNLPQLHQPPDGGTSVLGSEELEGLYEDAGEDFDASSDVDPRFGEGFSHISSDFSLLNLQFYLKTGDHAYGLTIAR